MALVTVERLKQLNDAAGRAWDDARRAQMRENKAALKSPAIKKLDAQIEQLYKKRSQEIKKLPTYEKLNRLEARAQQIGAAAVLAEAILRCESISNKE